MSDKSNGNGKIADEILNAVERRLRILIVSDDAADKQTVSRALSADGMNPILKRVTTEEEMQLTLDRDAWDLVLIDAYLTNNSPKAIIKALSERVQETPFLVMYGSFEDITALELLQIARDKTVTRGSFTNLAAYIQNAIGRAGDRMMERIKLEEAALLIMNVFGRSLDMRDKETSGHTQRVAGLTLKLARLIGIERAKMIPLYRGALLHDVGKIGVSDTILLKPGKLNDEERAQMQTHPDLANNMLGDIEFLQSSVTIPYCHHEKWDGTGYPRGLKGDMIPLEARIFSIVDVYDSLTSDRPYRKAWKKEDALKYIHDESRTSFDPGIVPVFLEMMVDAE